MGILEYLEKIKRVQAIILIFINDDSNIEENFENLKLLISDSNILKSKHELKLVLHFIIKISNNYHRSLNFFNKIEQILQILKTEIKENFTNSTIFDIFKSNKRILLFLINEGIISIDNNILSIMINSKYQRLKYPQYFYHEIKLYFEETGEETYSFIDENSLQKISDFKEKQKLGKNENHIVKIIENDLIEEFKSYTKQENILLKSSIKTSIFETNSFLMKQKETSLIEYAAFYGSIQIFQYLVSNKVELTPSLWVYAIHSNNLNMIHLLEESHIKPKNKSYVECFIESIKCHHNDISYYLQSNYLSNELNLNIYTDVQGENAIFYHAFPFCLKYYNFNFVLIGFPNYIALYYLCKYDFYYLVEVLTSIVGSNINNIIIYLNAYEICQ